MSRKTKFHESQFEDCLRDHTEPIPKRQLAKEVGCSEKTATKYVRRLRLNRVPVLPLQAGLALKEHIKKFPDALDAMKSAEWIANGFAGLVIIYQAAQPQFLEAARIAMKKLPRNEQRAIREVLYQLGHLSSNAEIDGLLEEENEVASVQLGM